jgi:hypothetical protein
MDTLQNMSDGNEDDDMKFGKIYGTAKNMGRQTAMGPDAQPMTPRRKSSSSMIMQLGADEEEFKTGDK